MRQAIVTGGAGLIGSDICAALARAGWRVASFDLQATSADAIHLHCDVGDEASVTAAFGDLGWDGIDLLVNNAGIANPVSGSIAALSLDGWRRIVDSHLTGTFLMTRAAVPLMRAGGSIVNITSTRAFMSESNTEAYSASKGGQVALTHALSVSLGPRIRVNAIAPGWIDAGDDLRPADHAQHPAGRVGSPEDVAEAVIYLADAGFMTGQTLTLDGGMTRRMIYED